MSNNLLKRFKLFTDALSSGGGGIPAAWGAITGTLSDQTDLQNALDGKLDTTATTADVVPSTDRNYVTDAELVVIGDTSGTNTGDETQSSIISKLALHSGTVNIDFGKDGVLSENDLVITTVSASWVTSTTKIQCFVENDGTDHTGEDVYLENIVATVYNIVPNTSFDIIAVAHNLTWGRYKITYKEII